MMIRQRVDPRSIRRPAKTWLKRDDWLKPSINLSCKAVPRQPIESKLRTLTCLIKSTDAQSLLDSIIDFSHGCTETLIAIQSPRCNRKSISSPTSGKGNVRITPAIIGGGNAELRPANYVRTKVFVQGAKSNQPRFFTAMLESGV